MKARYAFIGGMIVGWYHGWGMAEDYFCPGLDSHRKRDTISHRAAAEEVAP